MSDYPPETPKNARTKLSPQSVSIFCTGCKRVHKYAWDCPNVTREDLKKFFEQTKKDEQWARDRAAHWLKELQLRDAKIALLKHENNKLRKERKDVRKRS